MTTATLNLAETQTTSNPNDQGASPFEIPDDASLVANVYRLRHGRYLLIVPKSVNGNTVSVAMQQPDREDALRRLEYLCKCAEGYDWHRPQHPQVAVYCPIVETTLAVDRKMKPLLEVLWERGVMTFNSCEDNVPVGHAWIQFADRESAHGFARLCRDIVRVGQVIVTYHEPRGKTASVRFPKGRIRELAKAVRNLGPCLCESCVAARGAV
jgi:hypothetical protein